MGSSKIYIRTLIRGLLIILNAILIAWFLVIEEYYITAGVLGVTFILQSIELVSFHSRISRKLRTLLSAVRNKDYAIRFADDKKNSDISLMHEEINALLRSFRNVRIEKEGQFHYLRQLVNILRSGIISFTDDKKIHLFNTEAQKILNCPAFSRMDIFDTHFRELSDIIAQMRPGQNRLWQTEINGNQIQLSLSKQELEIASETHTIINFQNISDQIEKKELEAYERLVRVLTHEILNSVSPMISISDTLLDLSNSNETISGEDKKDLEKGLSTLNDRSKAILKFTEDYRSYITLPRPKLSHVHLSEIIKSSTELFRRQLEEQSIELFLELDQDVWVLGDEGQLNQAIINLIKNSVQALKQIDQPILRISLEKVDRKARVLIEDNGPGIPQSRVTKIFVPFYSTKEGGSGIGLSLTRTIIHSHNGRITVQSVSGKTTFQINLPLVGDP